MNDKLLLTCLQEIYRVNNQLILFAEAKNAGIIAFNGAIIVGMSTIIKPDNVPLLWWSIIYIIILNAASVVIALSSLVAQKRPREQLSSSTRNENYLFYGTISHLKPQALLDGLQIKYGMSSSNPSLEKDYARQIIIITQIASRKFSRFNLALGITILAVTTPVGLVIYLLLFNPNRGATVSTEPD